MHSNSLPKPSFPKLHPSLQKGIRDLGFEAPTPIQLKAIPPALAGRDVLACAMTGSGKTAAFLLPILQQLLSRPRGKTRALVISPTRELAAQIVEHFAALARHTPLQAAAVYGGVGMQPQEKAFRRGVDLIVACPGRLLDHFSQPYARLADLEFLVLDEADRMLDMGFLPDIRRVLRHIPEVEQTLFFSATMPPQIAQLSRELLYDPVSLDVERPAAPATGVRQGVYSVRRDLKTALIIELLQNELDGNALVFTRTKHRADRLHRVLSRNGIASERIHGNRSQAQRTRALAGFKTGDIRVLVATDIAARGIDVEALSHVINFDVPHMPEDYIHRVGRTARAKATGEARTFVSQEEINDLRGIERALGHRLPRLEAPGFDAEAQKGEALEIPLAERLAAMRARRSEERARARAKAQKKDQGQGRGQRRSSTQDQPDSGRGSAPKPGRRSSGPARGGSQGRRPATAGPRDSGATAGGDARRGNGETPQKKRRPRRRFRSRPAAPSGNR